MAMSMDKDNNEMMKSLDSANGGSGSIGGSQDFEKALYGSGSDDDLGNSRDSHGTGGDSKQSGDKKQSGGTGGKGGKSGKGRKSGKGSGKKGDKKKVRNFLT
jgi:hypothetical protein